MRTLGLQALSPFPAHCLCPWHLIDPQLLSDLQLQLRKCRLGPQRKHEQVLNYKIKSALPAEQEGVGAGEEEGRWREPEKQATATKTNNVAPQEKNPLL